MAKYLVETYYTCSFKVSHYLNDIDEKKHREVFSSLRLNNIGVQLHYSPVHLQPFYKKLGFTKGLGLIPGVVKPLEEMDWQIGWNTLEAHDKCPLTSQSDGENFYYNHSYEFQAPEEYIVGYAKEKRPIVSVVKKENIYGMQFHPEKSQISGFKLIRRILEEFTND